MISLKWMLLTLYLHIWTWISYYKTVLSFKNQQKSDKNWYFSAKNKIFSANLALLQYIIIQNDVIKFQRTLDHHTDTLQVHGSYVNRLISELANIGSFWQFLATFGIEIVTRWKENFFKYSIWLKTSYTNVR